MSETKFTPGPWVVDESGDVTLPEGGLIASVFDGILSSDTDRDIAEANALLIAAAPEMYEALKACIDGKVTENQNAVHPSKRFCSVCGINSSTIVHRSKCPINLAELALSKAVSQ